jgi:hypothetical protein
MNKNLIGSVSPNDLVRNLTLGWGISGVMELTVDEFGDKRTFSGTHRYLNA